MPGLSIRANGSSLPLVLIKQNSARARQGRLPSQSPSGDSSPEGRAKSRLPLWGRCPPKEGGEGQSAPAAHVRYPLDEHERQRAAIGANREPRHWAPRAGDEKMGELAGNLGSMRAWQLPQVRELDRKTAALSSRAAATPPCEGVRKPA